MKRKTVFDSYGRADTLSDYREIRIDGVLESWGLHRRKEGITRDIIEALNEPELLGWGMLDAEDGLRPWVLRPEDHRPFFLRETFAKPSSYKLVRLAIENDMTIDVRKVPS